MGSLKKIAQVALPIAGSLIPGVGPIVGAAIGGGLGGAIGGGGIKGILKGAAIGGAGNALGSSIGGSLTGSLAKAGASNTFTNSLANSSIGRLASNTIGPATGSSLIGGALGKFAGNSIAGSMADSLSPPEMESADPSGPTPFSPSRDAAPEMPNSLSSFGGLAPDQQTSNIATQGVYGGGLGGQEQEYFKSLINRKLIDDSGGLDQDLSEISPIESGYLSKIGLGGYGDTRSLLEAMSRWKPA